MTKLVFELFAGLARLAQADEVTLTVSHEITTIGAAVAALAAARPELASLIERCACVSGDTIVRRQASLPADGRIALLPPVAGG
jgi:molybdopterin synthase sulfur carrier subunit